MARVFIDGFESGKADLWEEGVGTPTVSSGVSGCDGTYCLNVNWDGSMNLQKIVPAADFYYVAFLIKFTDNAFPYGLLAFKNGTTVLGGIWRNGTSGMIELYKGSKTNLIATGTHALTYNGWHLIEIYYKPSTTSSGACIIKIDGVEDINFSGAATANNALQINRLCLGYSTGGGTYYARTYDNFVVDDSEFPGNTKIRGVVPTGAGSSTQWTPSTGNNYACVDELPAVDTDFVSVNVVDQVDLYAAGDLTDPVEAVKCVQVQARCLKEGTPTPQNIQLACRTENTGYEGDNVAVPTVAKSFCKLWGLNPNTGVAWTKTEVNAMEIGVKSVA